MTVAPLRFTGCLHGAALMVGLLLAIPTSTLAQTADDTARLGTMVESVWEFGLEVNAQANATGISATIPLPMDWPEQEIEIIDQQTTAGIGRLKQQSPSKSTRQIEFSINRMAAGQSETAVVRCRIRKRMLLEPQDTTQFSIATKVPSEVREFLKPSPYIESRDKRIREIADSLRDESLSGWKQVEKNFVWVRQNVEYEFDKTIRTCLEALDKGKGDCEELSSLFIAICRAQGIPARAVWIPDHTYPEFFLVDQNQEGHWFPCQAAGNYEFGAMTEVKPILQKGDRFRMAGQREDVRYISPSLIARDASGPIGIKWIRREVVDQ